MPLHAERERRVGSSIASGRSSIDRPAGHLQPLAEPRDALVVVGLGRVVAPRPPRARPASPAASRTSWSASSKVPSTRRWSSWPRSSGRCWMQRAAARDVEQLHAAADAEEAACRARARGASARARRRRARATRAAGLGCGARRRRSPGRCRRRRRGSGRRARSSSSSGSSVAAGSGGEQQREAAGARWTWSTYARGSSDASSSQTRPARALERGADADAGARRITSIGCRRMPETVSHASRPSTCSGAARSPRSSSTAPRR